MKRDSMYRSLESDGQTGNRLAKPPPEEPDALVAHVRVCEGPGRQRPGLLGTKKKTDAQAPAFEPALERLETIVGEMESGSLSLEDMMSRFEEGQSLVKVCSEKLNQVERRIEILMKEGDKVVAKPFAEAEPEAGEKDEDEEESGGTADGTPF